MIIRDLIIGIEFQKLDPGISPVDTRRHCLSTRAISSNDHHNGFAEHMNPFRAPCCLQHLHNDTQKKRN